MARIRFSGLVVDIRGSIGSTTLQKNAYGYTAKNKPNVISPNTNYQDIQKRYLLSCIQAWQAFDQATQNLWNAYAETYKQFSKHNQSAQLSGYNLFVKWNMQRLIGGDGLVLNPGVAPPLVPIINPRLTTGFGTLTFNIQPDATQGLLHYNLFLSREVSASKNFVGSLPRFVTRGVVQNTEANIYALYLARFGVNLNDGDFVFASIVLYGTASAVVFARRNYKLTCV